MVIAHRQKILLELVNHKLEKAAALVYLLLSFGGQKRKQQEQQQIKQPNYQASKQPASQPASQPANE